MHREPRYLSKTMGQPLTNNIKHKQVDANFGKRQLSVLYGLISFIPVAYAYRFLGGPGSQDLAKKKVTILKEKGTLLMY